MDFTTKTNRMRLCPKEGSFLNMDATYNYSIIPQHSTFKSSRICRQVLAGNNYYRISFSGTRSMLPQFLLKDPKTFLWIPEPPCTKGTDRTNKWNKIKKQPHSRRGACLPCVLKWDRNLDSSILASQESHVLRFTWEDRLVIYWPCLTTNRIMVC